MEHIFLSIQQFPGSGYLASLSGKGVTQTKVSFPESLYENTIQLLESKRGSNKNTLHPGLPVDTAKLEQQIINQLQKALLSGPIGEALIARQAAHAEGENLQLVIQSEVSTIRNLAWETVAGFSELGDSGRLVNLNIVRTMQPSCTAFQAQQIPAPTAAPLKLLFVTALPENISERGKELQIEDEQRKLIEAVGNLEATGDRRPKMVIEFLDVASLEEMTAALKARRHDILHISGHGGFNEKINQAVLHLENEDGDHLPTEAKDFAQALRGHDSLRLVVLSACETAVVGPDGGMVEAVAAIGVPAVLGMRFTVGDNEAKLFTTHFYQHLANGAPIADALSRARLELLKAAQEWKQAYPDHPRLGEWFTPVLYLNGAVGTLVDAELPFREMDDFYPRPADGKRRIGSGFIGRKRQLIQMRRAFRAGRHVCLVGMGGMGKTTLAEAFAANYENGAYDTIILRGGTEIHEFGILNQLVLAYGRRHGGKDLKALRNVIENGEMPILNRLHYVIGQCLKDEKVILVFDNFEDLQDQSGGENSRGINSEELRSFLGYLIAHCPAECHLLFTTRYRIEGLPDSVEVLNLDKLSPAEQYRWLSYSPWLRYLTSEERAAVYRGLDGLPRAFEFLEALAANDAAFDWETLEIEFELAKVQEQVIADLMLGRIYGLLSEELQRVFLVASVFFTRTPVGALVAVTEDVEVFGKLKMLLRWGLCFLDLEKEEIEMHALTREWVNREGLLEAKERKRVAFGAGEWFITNMPGLGTFLARDYFSFAQAWAKFNYASLSASKLCVLTGQYHAARRINNSLHQAGMDTYLNHEQRIASLTIEMYLAEKRNTKALIEEAISTLQPPDERLGRLYNLLGAWLFEDGETEEAKFYLEKSFTVAKEFNDWSLMTTVLNNLGHLLYRQGYYEAGYSLAVESLKLAKKNSFEYDAIRAENTIGAILNLAGRFEEAIEILQNTIEKAESIGHSITAELHNNYGLSCFNLGNIDLAFTFFERARKLSLDRSSKIGEAMALKNIASCWIAKGQYNLAFSMLEKVVGIQNDIQDHYGKALTLSDLAHLYSIDGNIDSSIQIQQEVLSIAKRCNFEMEILDSAKQLCLMHFSLSDNITTQYMLDIWLEKAKKFNQLAEIQEARAIMIVLDSRNGKQVPDIKEVDEILNSLTNGRGLAIYGHLLSVASSLSWKEGMHNQAIQYEKRGLEFWKSHGDIFGIITSQSLISMMEKIISGEISPDNKFDLLKLIKDASKESEH